MWVLTTKDRSGLGYAATIFLGFEELDILGSLRECARLELPGWRRSSCGNIGLEIQRRR